MHTFYTIIHLVPDKEQERDYVKRLKAMGEHSYSH